jgi:hypothetical protein
MSERSAVGPVQQEASATAAIKVVKTVVTVCMGYLGFLAGKRHFEAGFN